MELRTGKTQKSDPITLDNSTLGTTAGVNPPGQLLPCYERETILLSFETLETSWPDWQKHKQTITKLDGLSLLLALVDDLRVVPPLLAGLSISNNDTL